jgi:hypothetical protein
MTFSDALVVLGVALALVLYQWERASADRDALLSALNVLVALREAMTWGEWHFGEPWTEEKARERAQKAYDAVMNRSYEEVWRVPTEPLAALLQHPALGGLISAETVKPAGIALRQVGVYNQLVEQQAHFNAVHMTDIKDTRLPPSRRTALAEGAFGISFMLHRSAIMEATWWSDLTHALDANIAQFEAKKRERVWRRQLFRPGLVAAYVFLTAALVAVAWTGIDHAGATRY